MKEEETKEYLRIEIMDLINKGCLKSLKNLSKEELREIRESLRK